MPYNLFIAYDLMSPGQNYEDVKAVITNLGSWHQFQFSFFYVHTNHSPREAFDAIHKVMDVNDRLAVIDAQSGVVTDWDQPPIAEINAIWHYP